MNALLTGNVVTINQLIESGASYEVVADWFDELGMVRFAEHIRANSDIWHRLAFRIVNRRPYRRDTLPHKQEWNAFCQSGS